MRSQRRQWVKAGLNTNGRPYRVRRWTALDRQGLRGRERTRVRSRLEARERRRGLQRAGLNVRGQARVYKQRPALRKFHGAERDRERHRLWSAENIAAGLMWNGKARSLFRLTPGEAKWREFRAQMPMAA